MTRRILFVALLGMGLLVSGVPVGAVIAEQESQPATPRPETVALEVQGMESVMCEMGVKSALTSLDGVTQVSVDRTVGRAEVTFDPAVVSPQAFVQAVGEIGFQASLPAEVARRSAEGGGDRPRGHRPAAVKLKPQEIEKVAVFVAEKIMATSKIPSRQAIAEATGVQVSISDTPVLQKAVADKLAGDLRGQKLLSGSRCSDYGACSLWGNLATATGSTLAMYEREKALDGSTYDDFALPAFEALNLAGEKVRSTDLVGRPAVLAFLAVHCNHSMDTFPILQELHRRYGKQGLQVVGILVNSGSVEDAKGWVPDFAPEHPIWIYETASLGDLIGSHLVPTYLLVDGKGRVRKKIVGFKDQATVLAELKLLDGSGV